MATFSERVKELRKEKGMTQTDLAEAVGVTKGTVSTWETGARMPNFVTINDLCEIFDRRIDYVLGKSDDTSPKDVIDKAKQVSNIFAIEENITEYAIKYARLDDFGRRAVEALITVEVDRCRNEKTLSPAAKYSGRILIVDDINREAFEDEE